MILAKTFCRRRLLVALAGCWAAVFLAVPVRAASISEPATVFYGKIFGAGSGQPYLVTAGDLTWIIRRADGNNVVLHATLSPLNRGEYSYRLNVPHEATALGVGASAAGVPLGTLPDTLTHLQIALNGRTARILGPGGASFDVAQALRTSTYRLDLLAPISSLDSDGNGLPDWWETQYGLSDPNGDPDHDGLNNLAEYRKGSDPSHDDRIPSLATRSIRTVAQGTSLVLLRSTDSDSDPTNLVFTLMAAPDIGSLYVRNRASAGTDDGAALAVGASFTQDDVNHGRLVFVQGSPDVTALATRFDVSLRDENPAHPASTNSVTISLYRPAHPASLALTQMTSTSAPTIVDVAGFVPEEQPFVLSYLLSKEKGYIVGDGSGEPGVLQISAPSSSLTTAQYDGEYVPSHGHDRPHVILGGLADDHLAGGMEGDVLIGGFGNDSLRGNGGSDLFLIAARTDGNDTIEDFNVAEKDAIDIARVLVGDSQLLTNYVQLTSLGTNSYLGINFNGAGTGYTNMVLTLAGTHLGPADLRNLVENGNLITGDKGYASRVSLVASLPAASENGPVAGEFTLTRSGAAEAPLTVGLRITGSANNGSDYEFVESEITFAAGQRRVLIPIRPYVDAQAELTEVVAITVLAGDGYELGESATAQVTIEDLAPQISLEVLDGVADKSIQKAGVILVSRAGILDRSVLVRLVIAGTAANNIDYSGVPAFVNLLPGQTAAIIEVTPKLLGVLSNGVEYVQVTVKPDAAYKVMSPSSVRVMIVDETMSLGLWRQRHYPGATGDLTAFANADDGRGRRNLLDYAFGLNLVDPRNPSGQPAYQLKDGHLSVYFRQPAAVTDIQYLVEASEDLVVWHADATEVEQFFPAERAAEAETVCYRVKKAVSEAPQQYLRVRVVYSP